MFGPTGAGTHMQVSSQVRATFSGIRYGLSGVGNPTCVTKSFDWNALATAATGMPKAPYTPRPVAAEPRMSLTPVSEAVTAYPDQALPRR
jgi:hypothetical protein